MPSRRILLCFAVFSLLLIFPPLSRACDTWVALPNATKCGFTILAKNSDRPQYDCQPLMFYPRKKWPSGSKVNLGRMTHQHVLREAACNRGVQLRLTRGSGLVDGPAWMLEAQSVLPCGKPRKPCGR